MQPQELVEIEDIPRTEHETEPPPPSRPPAPVEVPNDEIIEAESVDFDLPDDLIEVPDEPPAPPFPEEKDKGEVFIVVEEEPQLIGDGRQVVIGALCRSADVGPQGGCDRWGVRAIRRLFLGTLTRGNRYGVRVHADQQAVSVRDVRKRVRPRQVIE